MALAGAESNWYRREKVASPRLYAGARHRRLAWISSPNNSFCKASNTFRAGMNGTGCQVSVALCAAALRACLASTDRPSQHVGKRVYERENGTGKNNNEALLISCYTPTHGSRSSCFLRFHCVDCGDDLAVGDAHSRRGQRSR